MGMSKTWSAPKQSFKAKKPLGHLEMAFQFLRQTWYYFNGISFYDRSPYLKHFLFAKCNLAEVSSQLWEWIELQSQLTGDGSYHQVGIALWPFGSISPKPLQLRGCWAGLLLVRNMWPKVETTKNSVLNPCPVQPVRKSQEDKIVVCDNFCRVVTAA